VLSSIGRYNILSELGKGGMAVVYRAFDTRLMREVAVKVIRTDDAADPSEQRELHRRLENEARAVAMLHHPGIVTVFDQGEFEGQAYIAMELIEGQTLGNLVRDQRLSIPERLNVLRDVAAALDFAHSKKVVHRDIKPANILVQPDGKAKITDFGIAKVDVLAATRTATGMLIGSLHYMAPEQIEGKLCTPATDQWGLAVTAFECITGRRPFDSDSIVSLCRQICDKPAPAPAEFSPGLPAQASASITRALDKDPNKRYPSCSEFLSALAGAFQVVQPPSQAKAPARFWIAAAVLLVAVAGAIAVGIRSRSHSSDGGAPVSVARSVVRPETPPSPPVVASPQPKVPATPPVRAKNPSKEPPRETTEHTVAAPARPQAPEAPNPEQLTERAETYEKNGVTARDQRDFSTARDSFLKAAAAGNAEAMRNLGLLYQNGQGVAQDLSEAMKWYGKAADAGNMVAMYNIGRLYQAGMGVPQDLTEAKKWYSKSALMGFPDAKEMLRVLSTPASPTPVAANPAPAPANAPSATKSAPPPAVAATPQPSPKVYSVGGGVSAPTVISKVDPDYTEEARAAKFQGEVVLYTEIGPDGLARNFKVVRPLGLGLDEKAIEAVKKWKFKPGYLNGQPVTVGAQIQVGFRLL